MSEPESLVAGLRAEIDRLRAYGFTLRSRCETLGAERDEAKALANFRWSQIVEALAARDEAVRALEPFAKLADQIDAWGHGDDSTCEHRLKASDIRRARAVLPAPPSGDAL